MAHDLVTELLQYSSLACFIPIWQLCANLLIPNCLRSNLSYSPLAALELYVKCDQAKNYDRYLRNSELQKHSKEARKLKEEEAKIKAENVRREMERIVALKEEAMRKEEEERLERQKREEEERKKREAENYARQHVSSQTQTRTPSSRGYA